jgi:hypothetical protein
MKEYPYWTVVTRRILVACAVLATLVGAAWVEENIRGDRVLREFEQRCAAEGKPLSFAFYKPAPIPDGENLFRAPVAAPFFNPSENNQAALTEYESGKPNIAHLDKLTPVYGDWMGGQGADFTKAFAALGQAPPDHGAPTPEAGAKLVLKTLTEMGPDLDAFDKAARERSGAQIEFSADYLPSFSALRLWTRALTLRAGAEIELGQPDKAYPDIFASLKMAEGVEHYPHHLTLMMGNVMAGIALQQIWEGCSRHLWTESQLAELEQAISNLHLLRDMPRALAGSRASYEAGFLTNLRKPWWMPLGWWKINIVRFFDFHLGGGNPKWFDANLERVDLAAIERSSVLEERLHSSTSPFDWLMRHEGWGTKIAVYDAFGQNRVEMAQVACALERYRLEHGSYPTELSDLVPAFIDAVPLDVIDHAPLRYERPRADRFRLYSIGLSGAYGKAWPGKPDIYRGASPGGYWVWPQPAGLRMPGG